MQVTSDIHAIKIPFKLQVSEEVTLDRFVYACLIYGKKICLIDCGVASSEGIIFDYLRKTGRSPEEVSLLILTHAHPDHIGGGRGMIRATRCVTASHEEDRPWIEDVGLQYKERPIMNFSTLVEGSFAINRELKDGDILDLGGGKMLRVIHTPGHSRGSVSLFLEDEGALFSGDAVPMAGGVPIYENVLESISSVRKLKQIKNLRFLLTSWDDPRSGDNLQALLDQGLRFFQQIHEAVLKEKDGSPSSDLRELCPGILRRLGLPQAAGIPIVMRSFRGHMEVSQHRDLLAF
jgi:glyoxylase-like metal-dependent hydrolase (beta-lactamase superfamily II)